MISLRPAAERGHAQHGWLDSWHSFSFADYLDPRHVHFGPLRVINEDRVKAGAGFPPHRHEDMEIISYVLDGELEHRDSLGNGSITHSEFNPSRTAALHFLQIWILPEVRGIKPEYEQRHVSAAERRGRLRLVASPDGAEESLRIHQDARVHAGLFDGTESAALTLAPGRLCYVHLARGALSVNGQALQAGDGAQLRGTGALALSAAHQAEVLVFDLPPD